MALSLKTRIVEAEASEPLLYGHSIWTLIVSPSVDRSYTGEWYYGWGRRRLGGVIKHRPM